MKSSISLNPALARPIAETTPQETESPRPNGLPMAQTGAAKPGTGPGSATVRSAVVFNKAMDAMYFSKAVIPFRRKPGEGAPTYQHIGLYGYRRDTLEKLVALEPTPFELTESLEQLRALENGIPIRVVLTDYRGRSAWSVDAPEDAVRVEEIIAREGELVA